MQMEKYSVNESKFVFVSIDVVIVESVSRRTRRLFIVKSIGNQEFQFSIGHR